MLTSLIWLWTLWISAREFIHCLLYTSTKGKIPQTGDVALFSVAGVAVAAGIAPVSYTHLDVYKRQRQAYLQKRCRCAYFAGPRRFARRKGYLSRYRAARLHPCLLYTSRCV